MLKYIFYRYGIAVKRSTSQCYCLFCAFVTLPAHLGAPIGIVDTGKCELEETFDNTTEAQGWFNDPHDIS